MRQMSSPVNQPVTTADNPEDILGQFYFAFGQGAGAMRVQREAISALRARYYGPIQTVVTTWDQIGSSVLSLLAQVGRLAALLATQAGRTSISSADFMQARQMVEATVHQKHEAAGLMAGPVCPVYSGDTVPVVELGFQTSGLSEHPAKSDVSLLENPTSVN